MAQPVWTLSVDLQTKTASFTTGLSDAARTARERFGEVRDAAQDMGDGVAESSGRVNYSMMEARHGVMMLGEEFGIHLPRGLTTFIASLGPVGAAMEMAFPFLAIILGATLLIEHLDKLKAKSEELATAQNKATSDTAEIFDQLANKMLQVGIRADELSGKHIAALHKQLQLIDRQTLSGIISELDKMGKDADDVFSKMQSNWFMQLMMGRADVGPAKKELADMIAEINKLKGSGADPGSATRALLGFDVDHVTAQIDALENKMKELRAARAHAPSTVDRDMDTNELNKLQQQKELYQQNLATLLQMNSVAKESADIGSGEKKNTSDAEGKRAAVVSEEDAKKARKIFEEIAKAHKELSDALEKDANEVARVNAFELEDGLKQEKKASDEKIKAYEAQAKIVEDLGKEEADHRLKMAALTLQSTEKQLKQEEQLGHIHGQELVNAQVQAQNESYEAQMQAYQIKLGALDKYGKDYEAKLKQIQDKEEELTQENENKITQIITTAEDQRKERIISAETRMKEAFAQTAANSIMGGKNMAQAFEQLGGQMLKTMLTNLMQLETVQGRKRFGDARTAAADAFADAGNPILGALEGAAAFAAVMAFNEGGIVPGVERGDVVPARLTPGEAVLPKALVDGLMSASQSGGVPGSNGDIHVHHHATYNVQAFDGDGVDRVLRDHSEKFANHMKGEIRRMNR